MKKNTSSFIYKIHSLNVALLRVFISSKNYDAHSTNSGRNPVNSRRTQTDPNIFKPGRHSRKGNSFPKKHIYRNNKDVRAEPLMQPW